jgi:hypothetical protein
MWRWSGESKAYGTKRRHCFDCDYATSYKVKVKKGKVVPVLNLIKHYAMKAYTFYKDKDEYNVLAMERWV